MFFGKRGAQVRPVALKGVAVRLQPVETLDLQSNETRTRTEKEQNFVAGM